jgi:3-deoxy-D-arabino-heptulosonate 7-phosphate (DAHP) synthase
MGIEQTLQKDIEESKRWVDTAEGVYKRDLIKRIELINWVLEQMKNPDTYICAVIESRMNENRRNKQEKIYHRTGSIRQ